MGDQKEWFLQCEKESARFNSLLLFAELKYRELARMTNLQTSNTLRTVFCLSLLAKLTAILPPSYAELLSLCHEEFKNHIFQKYTQKTRRVIGRIKAHDSTLKVSFRQWKN